MAKIPFKVSARTARLIGRENIASSKGAIIELVKNAYDADSSFCIVYFSSDSLYIIDAGEGMTQSIIINHWMTIGTNNKEVDYFTKSGRIKAGAKGIGRFALDRLGFETEMWTLSKKAKNNSGSYWKMDWKQFDDDEKSISEIIFKLFFSIKLSF